MPQHLALVVPITSANGAGSQRSGRDRLCQGLGRGSVAGAGTAIGAAKLQLPTMLIARAAISAMVTREMALWTSISSWARAVSGTAPVGLKAVAVQ